MDDHNEKLLAPANNDAACSPKDGNSNFVSSIQPQKRNRLSANEKRAKRKAVADDYQAGHPSLAIMLRQGLNKSQFTEIMAELFMKGNVTPMTSKYDVVDASTPIKALPKFARNTTKYIRVEHSSDSTILTIYSKESKNEQKQ